MKIPTKEEFPSHPGGQSTLSLVREKDDKWKGVMFLTAHLGCDQDRVAKTAKHLGVGEDLPKRGKLYNDIDAAVRRVKLQNPNAVWVYRFWCLFITFTIVASLVLFVLTGQTMYCCVFGASNLSYGFNIFHTRNHRGGIVYGIGWLDRLTYPLYELIDRTFGIRPEFWQVHHNGTHHIETNTLKDNDVNAPFEAGIRLSKQKPHYRIHEIQHIYTHVLLAGNLLLYPFNNAFQHGGSFVFLCLYCSLIYILPVYAHGWVILQTVFSTLLVSSLTTSYMFQVSHNHQDLGAPEEIHSKAGTNIDDWFKVQILESISWGGYAAGLFFGGINYQVEHHIAPCLCPVSKGNECTLFMRACVRAHSCFE